MFSLLKNQDRAFIVYQMGKVGSTTFKTSLEAVYGEKRVLHTHKHEEANAYIERWSKSFDEVIVITGFREPVSRCISAYFQCITTKTNPWHVGKQEEVVNKSIDWLINDYNTKAVPHIHNVVGPWLGNYERVTNRRLTEFSRAKGCLKASLNNVYYYIYKLETLPDFHKGMASDQYLREIKIANANESKEKWYAKIYRDFKRSYQISSTNYDELYGNIDFVRFLYDEQEIKELTKSFVVGSDPSEKDHKREIA